MNIGVPSRFACLKIEDDERPQSTKSKDIKKKPDVKAVPKKLNANEKSVQGLNTEKPMNNKQDMPHTSSKRKKNASADQWEEWKLKDNEIVNGTYEQDLQNAIMLSKLDYEHNKEMYKKNQEMNGKTSNQTQNKKKKNKVMSINEFLNSGSDKQNSSSENHFKSENDLKKEHFFDDIKIATKEELNKEQIIEKRKKREVNIDKIISLAQCQEKLEEERSKRLALQLELDKAKAEIAAVKERNKTLCGILGHGEMKDNDVLVELEKLYSEKNELAEEVSRLHVLLEQERSKVAAPTSDNHTNKHKDKKRKQKGV